MKTSRVKALWLTLSAGFLFVIAAHAATFPVTNLADSGPGSLRQAMLDANASPGDDTITLTNLTGQITLLSELPIVTDNMAMLGPGTNLLTISGNQQVRIFSFASSSTNLVSGLTLAGGLATNDANGAAVSNGGALTISGCLLSNNQTFGGFGGAIYSTGLLSVVRSCFLSNSVTGANGAPGTNSTSSYGGGGGGGAAGLGGAIFLEAGEAYISNSVFEANASLGGIGGAGGAAGTNGSGGVGGGGAGGSGGAFGANGGNGGFGSGGGGGGQTASGGTGGFGGGAGYPLVGTGGGAAGFGGGEGSTASGEGGPTHDVGTGGAGLGGGGALFIKDGSCDVLDTHFRNNRTTGGGGGTSGGGTGSGGGDGLGGAIFLMQGSLRISRCNMVTNQCSGGASAHATYRGFPAGGSGGGAVFVYGGTASLASSTVASNRVSAADGGFGTRIPTGGGDAFGGRVAVVGGSVSLTNCTLAANSATGGSSRLGSVGSGSVGGASGGGLYAGASLVLVNDTIAENFIAGGNFTDFFGNPQPRGASAGGGAFFGTNFVTMINTLVAGNLARTNRSDGSGTPISLGHNLFSTNADVSDLQPSDLVNVDPLIGPLSDNGGPTFTRALMLTSPARDAGSNSNTPPVDQRGVPRPQGGAVDIGAFEVQNVTILIDGQIVLAGSVSRVASAQVTLQTILTNGTIQYTLDGSEPGIDSTLYSDPFILTNSAIIRAIAHDGSFQQSAFGDTVNLTIIHQFFLSLTTNGEGSVVANPPAGPYAGNTVVTLTATPASNWLFKEWTGSVTGSSPTINVTMDTDKAVTAAFVPVPLYTLDVVNVGMGSVSLDPPGGLYASNTLITMTAIPAGRWLFVQWAGDVAGTNNPLQITMNTNKSVQAVFTTLYSIVAGSTGGGSVSLNPPGGIYTSNSVVSITANPSNGWNFLQWLGDANGTNPSTNILVDADKGIEALFGTALGIAIVGNGAVSVHPQAALYPFGYRVQLGAIPQPSNYFVLWGNAVSSTNNPIELTISNATPSVTAVFSSLTTGQVTLSIVVEGGGHVEIAPYANRYSVGQTVNLRAVPEIDESFLGWTGDISGTNDSVSILMNASKVATARFTKRPRLAIAWSGLQPYLGNLRLFISDEIGSVVAVEAVANLGDTNRPTIATLTNTHGKSTLTDPQVTNMIRRFYRGQKSP